MDQNFGEYHPTDGRPSTHYTQTKKYRSLALYDIFSMTEDEVFEMMKKVRFGAVDKQECPDCKTVDSHWFIKTRKQWTCKNCKHRFSVTSGSVFNNTKLPLRKILLIALKFVSSPQGTSASSVISLADVSYKTAYLNLMKIREAIYETRDQSKLTGTVHIDCMYICGKPRKGNPRLISDSASVNAKLRNRKYSINPDRSTYPESWNIEKHENSRVVLAMCQVRMTSDGSYGSDRTIFYVIPSESWKYIKEPIKNSVSRDAIIMTDGGRSYGRIYTELGITHKAVNHSKQYMDEFGVNNNMAECFFSRIRRSEFGVFNAVAPQYLAFYIAEFVYRNDHNKYECMTVQFEQFLSRIMKKEPSKAFTGYCQGKRLGFEHIYKGLTIQ